MLSFFLSCFNQHCVQPYNFGGTLFHTTMRLCPLLPRLLLVRPCLFSAILINTFTPKSSQILLPFNICAVPLCCSADDSPRPLTGGSLWTSEHIRRQTQEPSALIMSDHSVCTGMRSISPLSLARSSFLSACILLFLPHNPPHSDAHNWL